MFAALTEDCFVNFHGELRNDIRIVSKPIPEMRVRGESH